MTLANQKNTSLTGEPEPDIEVGIDDTEGVKSIFEGLKARAAAKFGKR
ncbi:hypothetical protein MKK84_19530 [Methylobacterium sp. E-065]|nr:hypothetical protein [Methylobacterium sp. E-065]MCJ2019598.1 hypothetical protein [Methylobacterium sp. E-065]